MVHFKNLFLFISRFRLLFAKNKRIGVFDLFASRYSNCQERVSTTDKMPLNTISFSQCEMVLDQDEPYLLLPNLELLLCSSWSLEIEFRPSIERLFCKEW